VGVEWGMVIMGYVQVRLKYPDVSQPALKTDSVESVKKDLPYLRNDVINCKKTTKGTR
jgi:hypothetical protein